MEANIQTKQLTLVGNRLLDGLPARDLRRVMGSSKPVNLVFGDVLHVAGERIRDVYFPVTGAIGLIMSIDRAASLEVGSIGSEGMFGVSLVLDIDVSPLRALVQRSGRALRIDTPSFILELKRSQSLRTALFRYAFVHMSQLARSTACMRFHVVEARLARWLLASQDRARADTFHVTHAFLAEMLGVRRVGVTRAAGSLQKRALIDYSRGNITVIDRRGLKAAACGCYEADRETYASLL